MQNSDREGVREADKLSQNLFRDQIFQIHIFINDIYPEVNKIYLEVGVLLFPF